MICRSVYVRFRKFETCADLSRPNQTINPLNNPALLTLTARQSFSSNLRLLGTFFEILVKIGTLEAMLDSIHRNMPLKPTSRMSRLERSLVSMESRSFQHDSTQPLGKFFEEMGQSLRCLIDDKDFEPQEDVQVRFLLVNRGTSSNNPLRILHYLSTSSYLTFGTCLTLQYPLNLMRVLSRFI